ncbi:LysR family transcriptional regulator [Roseibium sp. Sym1]|uniref:LysR family transcriptional regulator n=1 Tax=Roseibium sp. Sym1 TaxID=3016006 RepID=UPI0022B33BC0|nr:LysR family transcriptional regulator [Roseibium sp. Sym1]
MDMKHLKTFLAVAEAESFHRAASRLNITQAAVSSRIRALEEELDVELFVRGAGGTRLSEAGEYLRPLSEQMLANWQQISGSIGRRFANRLALRIGCQLSIWDPLLVELTVWAETNLGKLPLTLNFDHDSNAIDLVRRQVLDLTITHEKAHGSKLETVPLSPEKMVLVADRPCRASDPDLPMFLNFQLGPQYDAATADLLGDRSGHFFLSNATMGIAYLKRRGGMAYCPRHLVAEALAGGELYEVAGAETFDIDRFAVYDPHGSAAALVEQVLPGLMEVARQTGT